VVRAEIGVGLVVLVGILCDDTEADRRYVADKIVNLRIFPDAPPPEGKMNLSVLEVSGGGGGVLLVPNFTVPGDTRKGRRPSFAAAMKPPEAEREFERLAEAVRSLGCNVQTGVFGAHMHVALVNDGPVTVIVDS